MKRRPLTKVWKPTRRKPRFKVNRSHLHAYEEWIIVRDLNELGGVARVSELRFRFPMRYHDRYLVTVLARMVKAGRLRRTGFRPYAYAVEPGTLAFVRSRVAA